MDIPLSTATVISLALSMSTKERQIEEIYKLLQKAYENGSQNNVEASLVGANERTEIQLLMERIKKSSLQLELLMNEGDIVQARKKRIDIFRHTNRVNEILSKK